MKIFFLISLYFLTLNLNATEIKKEDFPLIQPVSVESAQNTTKSYFGDLDKDGVSDDKDNCPNTPKGVSVDIFGCAVLDDSDNDGVPDKDDKCQNSTDGATVNLEGCEPDSDSDGVPDFLDKCEYTSEEFTVDNVGCPKGRILNIEFNDKEALTSQSLQEIESFAEFLEENTGYQVIIFSFSDDSKDEQITKTLTQNRAKTVMNAIIDSGVKLTRLTAIGMGSKNPIADNQTPQGRKKNNRIEVEILQ